MVINDLTNPFFAELAVGIDDGDPVGRLSCRSSPIRPRAIDRQREVIASMREHGVSGLIDLAGARHRGGRLQPLTASGHAGRHRDARLPGARCPGDVRQSRRRHAAAAASDRARPPPDRLPRRLRRHAVFDERLSRLPRRPARSRHRAPAIALVVELAPRRGPAASTPSSTRTGAGRAADRGSLLQRCGRLRRLRRSAQRAAGAGRDFAVVGFDDVVEAKHAVPALTTVSVDPQGWASAPRSCC